MRPNRSISVILSPKGEESKKLDASLNMTSFFSEDINEVFEYTS
jgi:hypothetical protein